MTTDLSAWLTAAIAMEDRAARELAALLDQAVRLLQEDADSREQAADDAEPTAKTPEDLGLIGDLRDEAAQRWDVAADLGTWIGNLNAALMLPPEQREALE